MNKIMVIGVSAGAGKSTFAKELGKKTGIPVYHLDTYFWKPGWIQAEFDEFAEAQEKIVKKSCWIIEGNYSATQPIRAKEADTVIYLELPLRVCLYRVLKRWVQNYGRTREDLGEGCPEKMDLTFLKFIIKTYKPRKKNLEQRIELIKETGNIKHVYLLKSQREIDGFFSSEIFKKAMLKNCVDC